MLTDGQITLLFVATGLGEGHPVGCLESSLFRLLICPACMEWNGNVMVEGGGQAQGLNLVTFLFPPPISHITLPPVL